MKIAKVIAGVLFIATVSANAYAQNRVVVIPIGGDSVSASDCPPATASTSIGGPAFLHGYCWYLGDDGETCDTVCGDVKGANLANFAENEWSDDACAVVPGTDDVSTWFYNNGNPGGWTGQTSATSAQTLGYGYRGSTFYGKCSTGSFDNVGTYPATLNVQNSSNVCACLGAGW